MGSSKSMLVIQDDSYSESLHLDEVILSLIPSAECGAAAFAFATRDGLNAVFNSEEFQKYCRDGHHFELYIGVDSVTSENTLEFARDLSAQLGGRLIVKVYYHDNQRDIFHPKTTWFKLCGPDEGGTALIGSGNLTMAGLQRNTEMFGWIEQDPQSFDETIKRWNRWLEEAAKCGRILDVTDSVAMARARENRWGGNGSIRIENSAKERQLKAYGDNALMISAIPSQKTRGWTQFTMAKRYYSEYFGFEYEELDGRIITKGSRRVLLHAVNDDGTLMPAESRGGNISGKSRNFRMEIDGARNVVVAVGKKPMVVFVKTGDRDYIYKVYGTDSPYNERLADFARRHNSDLKKTEGAKCCCDVEPLLEEMPELAIFRAEVSSE